MVECSDSGGEAVEEISGINVGGLPKSVDRSCSNERIEFRNVDIDRSGTESNRVAVAGDEIGRKMPHSETKIARKAADIFHAEQRGEIVQWNGSIAMKREPNQNRLRFPAADLQRISAVIRGAKFSKQTNCENRHRLNLGRTEYHNSGPSLARLLLSASDRGGTKMNKTLASITVVLLLTAFGCANWNRYTPAGMDDDAIATEIRKNLTGAGYTGMTVDVHKGAVTLKGDVKTRSDRQKAIDEARKVKGVTSVTDEISIKP